jgi:predicted HicB family RNase H-like nuclease
MKKEKNVVFVRVNDDVYEDIRKAVHCLNISINKYVTDAILNRLEKDLPKIENVKN